MRTMRFSAFLTAALLVLMCLTSGAQSPQSAKEAEHNRKGMQHYSEAFYQHLPKGKQREADQSFELAISEFRQAIAANPRFADPYRNLARLYYVKKDFLQAADAYKRFLSLEPRDVDAYLQLALSYTELDRFPEAIQTLETARRQTADPEVRSKLDGYLTKLKDRN